MTTAVKIATILVTAMALASCGGDVETARPTKQAAPPPSNRIHLSGPTRENLGVTWGKARRGRLEMMASVPGEIVARPGHEWTVQTPLAGTVTRVTRLWEEVKKGDTVAEIAAPELAEWQAELQADWARAHEARLDLDRARAEVRPQAVVAETLTAAAKDAREAVTRAESAVIEAHRVAKSAVARLAEVTRLRESEAVSAADLLAAQRGALEVRRSVIEAERALRTARVEAADQALRAATERADAAQSNSRIALIVARVASTEAEFERHLSSLAAATGLTVKALSETEDGSPAWARLSRLSLRAPSGGVVVERSVAAGTWVERNDALLRVLDPTQLAFRAKLPEADIASLPRKLSVQVVSAGIDEVFQASEAEVRPVGDAATRSILLETWVANPDGKLRVGTSATARILMSEGRSEEVLVPLDCVIRDGLESIVFRRDPGDPDDVIRTVVTLGKSSAGWVEVIAGVGAGDQIVKDGVLQLREAGGGRPSAGGHFHADGTFHDGGDHD